MITEPETTFHSSNQKMLVFNASSTQSRSVVSLPGRFLSPNDIIVLQGKDALAKKELWVDFLNRKHQPLLAKRRIHRESNGSPWLDLVPDSASNYEETTSFRSHICSTIKVLYLKRKANAKAETYGTMLQCVRDGLGATGMDEKVVH